MPIPSSWSPLKYHPIQRALWITDARFAAVVAGRGSGKTDLARRRIVWYLGTKSPLGFPDQLFAYALPTINMAKRIAWPKIKSLVPQSWIADINETELRIKTKFGNTLYVFGMDKPQRAEGSQYDGVVIDESSDQKPSVFNTTFLPALSHRKGWCWRIGAPKRYGIGAEDFKKFFNAGLKGKCILNDPLMRIASFTWSTFDMAKRGIISWSEIEFAKENSDSKDFNEQYGGQFETAGGTIYYAYSDKLNVDVIAGYNPAIPISITCDFNVSPMAWLFCHRFKDKLLVFDELWMKDTCTQAALDECYRRYSTHTAGFEFFGDATGRARKTAASSAAQSDYVQICNDKRFTKKKVIWAKSNPSITDRFASVNAMICNAKGVRRLFIHPKCKNLRNDLEHRAYIEGTREPDNSNPEHGHITDALGYLIHRAYPLRAINEGNREAFIGQIPETGFTY